MAPPDHDVVDVGMVLKSSSPGVQHTEEAWEIPADVLLIESQFFDRLGGRLE